MLSLYLHLSSLYLCHLITVVFVVIYGLDCFINSVLAYVHVPHIYCLKISLTWYFVNWGSKSSKCFIHYLNIQPPTRKWLQIFETLHLASLQIITFDHFLNNTSHFEIGTWNFWYFNIENEPLAFWAPYISIKGRFPFFPVKY